MIFSVTCQLDFVSDIKLSNFIDVFKITLRLHRLMFAFRKNYLRYVKKGMDQGRNWSAED